MRRIVDRLRPAFRKLTPVAKVVQTATGVIGQIQKPTVFGVANAVSGGLTTIGELLAEEPRRTNGVGTALSYGFMVQAFRSAGADVIEKQQHGGSGRYAICTLNRIGVEVADRESEIWYEDKEAALELCRRVFDRALPPVIRIVDGDDGPAMSECVLTDIVSPQSSEILTRTMQMLDGGRAILLEGRPGVGKTTIAQCIARDSKLGRVVVIDGETLCKEGSSPGRRGLHKEALQLLSPGVVIVDDIDKIKLPLKRLEMIRAGARLVIMTANNGKHDAVLDAALMRPARIDEVFTIASDKPHRRAPFDLLNEDEWREVIEWPCAYVNEVEKRLRASVPVHLDELRERVKARTRSGEELL